ncbi:MAG: hypothetical protein EAX96_20870 [Candidatus Lokiarchaeota archaeon]|nr:hypothetical protein [Candidatus Lokiarchaeota archaeon]
MKINDLTVIKHEEINPNTIIFYKPVRSFCKLKYRKNDKNKLKTCPNHGKNPLCPPLSKYREDILKKYDKFILVWIRFDFITWKEQREEKHPGWTPGMVANLLHYQKSLKKLLKDYIKKHFNPFPDELFGCGSGFWGKQSMESAGMLVLDLLNKSGEIIKKGIYSLNGIRFEQKPTYEIVLSSLLCFKNKKSLEDYLR